MADLAYNQVYQALRHQLGGGDQPQLRQQASEFQKQVRAACGIPRSGAVRQTQVPAASSCVEHAYDAQRSAWMRRLDPAALSEVARAPKDLIEVQRNLQFFGYLSALEPIDGVFGTNTRDAIKAWQTATHREVNGFVRSGDNLEMTLARLRRTRDLLAAQKAGQGAASSGGTPAIEGPPTAQEAANRSPGIPTPDAREEAAMREASEKARAEEVMRAAAERGRVESLARQAEAQARQEAPDRQAAEKEKAEREARQEAESEKQAEPSYGQNLMSSILGYFQSGQSDLQIWQQIAKQPEQLSRAEQAENVFRCAGVFSQIEGYSVVGAMYYATRDVMAQRVGFTLDRATALIVQGKESYSRIQEKQEKGGNGTLTSEMQATKQNFAMIKVCSEWNEGIKGIFGQM